MDVVFGEGPVAVALAHRLGRVGSTILATRSPRGGPFLWRFADVASGRGVKAVVEGADRVFVAVEDEASTGGLFLVLRKLVRPQGAVLVPLGTPAPPGLAECPTLARVHHGPAWGPEEPLVAAWTQAIRDGRRLWLADPGTVRPVTMGAVTAAAVEAAGRGPVRWTVAGTDPVGLPDLATELARRLGRPLRSWKVPTRWAAWRAGVPEARLTRWIDTPVTPTVTDGWQPPGLVDRAGWAGEGPTGPR